MAGGPSAAAFVGHLESVDEYRAFFSSARGPERPALRLDQIEPVLRNLDPMPICDFVLRSPTGAVATARYIDAFLLVDAKWRPSAAIHRVEVACRVAAQTGARLVTLGGFSSIVGESARLNPTDHFGVPFTTGNTLTAAVVAEQVLAAAVRSSGCRVTVVGASGDVGSGVCRILHAHGIRPTLVGRRPGPLAELAAELPGTMVRGWPDATGQSDIVVLVSSAAFGAVSLADVPASCLILDAGHPPNAQRGVHPRYGRAGRVVLTHPLETDLPAILAHYSPGELHSCLAEGMALTLEGRWEAYSKGRGLIMPQRAAEILHLADRHGIHPAPLRCGDD